MIEDKASYNIPLYLILGFNFFTVIAFITAPFDYEKGNPELVVMYLLLNYFFIFFGYRRGVKKGLKKGFVSNPPLFNPSNKFIFFIFTFYFLTFLVKYAYLLRFNILDVSGMFSFLSIGIIDPQLGYYLSVYDTRPFTVSWSVFSLISIVNQVFFIIGFLTWRRLGIFLRFLFIFFLIIEVYYWLGRGTGFGIITLVTTLTACIFADLKKFNLRIIVVSIVLFITGVSAFGYLKDQRAGGVEIDLQQFAQASAPVIENHYMFDLLPKEIVQTYMHSIAYLTQGYYHLGLSFDLPFTSTFFFGNNPAGFNLAKIFGFDLWKNSYMWKLYREESVDDLGKWHSAYLWYANDISIIGVPILLFFLSFFTGYAYSLIRRYNDMLSKILFIILINMFIFLFANNSFLSQHYYSAICIFLIWYFSRVKTLKI